MKLYYFHVIKTSLQEVVSWHNLKNSSVNGWLTNIINKSLNYDNVLEQPVAFLGFGKYIFL